jgi:hypothetical protein
MVPTASDRDIDTVMGKLLEIEAITPMPNWRFSAVAPCNSKIQ